MDEEISRRQWVGSVTKASLLGVALGSTNIAARTEMPASPEQKPQDAPFDIHQHVEPSDDSFSDFGSAEEVIAKDYAARVKIMDANGIEESVIMAGNQYRKTEGIGNTRKLNDLVATYVAKHSDRFPIGIGTVEVTHGDASLRELERIAKDLKLRGAVWHHGYSGVPINHRFMRPILRTVEELNLIPFVHVYQKGNESWWRLEVLAEEFPNITFVALAGIASVEDREQALHIVKRRRNILCDTGPVFWRGEPAVESFVKQVGVDRLLFGSDLYAMQPSYRQATTTLQIIRNSQLSKEEKAKILSGNARKLLGL